MKCIVPPSAEFAYPTLPITAAKVAALADSLIGARLHYGLGAKIPLHLQAQDLAAHGITACDCSAESRWLLFHALGQPADFDFPDGSVQQHEYIAAKGFKKSTYEDATNHDGVIRIAFLEPNGSEPGHVLLVDGQGRTCESHGGVGPSHRVWDADQHGFMREMAVFALALP